MRKKIECLSGFAMGKGKRHWSEMSYLDSQGTLHTSMTVKSLLTLSPTSLLLNIDQPSPGSDFFAMPSSVSQSAFSHFRIGYRLCSIKNVVDDPVFEFPNHQVVVGASAPRIWISKPLNEPNNKIELANAAIFLKNVPMRPLRHGSGKLPIHRFDVFSRTRDLLFGWLC